jgi:hypothetical protein
MSMSLPSPIVPSIRQAVQIHMPGELAPQGMKTDTSKYSLDS